MKPYKILLFILLVISLLGVISFLFPDDGISIGEVNVRFPSIENVLTGQSAPEPEIENEPDSVQLQKLESLKDTLHEYKVALVDTKGHIILPDNDITFFDDMFASMQNARANKRVVRVIHYGDSQIEMDRLSNNLRSFFQSTFGGGGPGLVPVIQTIPSYAVSQYASGNFTLKTTYGDGDRAKGNYGLMAKCYRLQGAGSFTATASQHKSTDSRVKRFSNVTLLFNNRSGEFKTTLKDRKSAYQQDSVFQSLGVQAMHWQLDSSTTSLNLMMQGFADIYGIMLDDGYGVAVDNIPMRGTSGTQFTMITDTLLRDCYQLADVGLLILQFGGNSVPSIHTEKSIHNYCNELERQVKYLRRLHPNTPILFIGPSDMGTKRNGRMQTYPLLPQLIDSLKSTMNQNHVAYWDMYEVMGGENSMVAWVKNGLAGPDYIHFTTAGANRVGNALVRSFAELYDFYCTRKNMDDGQFEELWGEVVQ